jgi:hypothetical protein
MPALLVVIIFFILSLLPANIFGQDQNVSARTQELVSEFNKTKHKVKDKRGIRIEIYIEVRSEAAVKRPEEYAGVYQLDGSGAALELRVSGSGAVEAIGEDAAGRAFKLTNGRIEGALLTATKTYSNGEPEKFEAVFINRRIRSGKSPADAVENETVFGLGVAGQQIIRGADYYNTRVFYERKR